MMFVFGYFQPPDPDAGNIENDLDDGDLHEWADRGLERFAAYLEPRARFFDWLQVHDRLEKV